MARVYKFAQKEYGIESETIAFYGHDLTSFTYNDLPVMGQGGISTLVTAPVGAVPNTAGASISHVGADYTLTLQPASATQPGIITAGVQSLNGNKTIVGNLAATNLSGTNTGDLTLAAVGASPSANGATLAGQVLTIQPASATLPGAVTAGTQTIGGNKTWNGQQTFATAFVILPSITVADDSGGGCNLLMVDDNSTVHRSDFFSANGIASTTGQVCSLTNTQIGFGSMTFSQGADSKFSFASNKFTFASRGTYLFQIKLQFSAGPTEYSIVMRQGASGGALSPSSEAGSISSSAMGGGVIVNQSFYLFAQGTTATDVDFTIRAQSFPAATFPTINTSGSIEVSFVSEWNTTSS